MDAGNDLSRIRAHGAIDALRAGVVNRYIAEHLTYGREAEIRGLEDSIRDQDEGSTHIVLGGYGVGKSHLAEVLALRLEESGYAVARLEMGASDGRAESPQAVLGKIARNLRVKVGDRVIRGPEVDVLVHALEKPGFHEHGKWDYEPRRLAHEEMPGPQNALRRFEALRDAQLRERSERGYAYLPPLFGWMPKPMTAVNYAVRNVNGAAHRLRRHGFKGIVVLFDEAERSEWASTYYRTDRAKDLMLGFALASANKNTQMLKHYRNEDWFGYLQTRPARIHSVFMFTWAWGLVSDISRAVGIGAMNLERLAEPERLRLRKRIQEMYEFAYAVRIQLDEWATDLIAACDDYEDVRAMVRTTVAALDYERWSRELENGHG